MVFKKDVKSPPRSLWERSFEKDFTTRAQLLDFFKDPLLNLDDRLAIQIATGAETSANGEYELKVNRKRPLRNYDVVLKCHESVGYSLSINSINGEGDHLIGNLRFAHGLPYLE